MSYFPNSASTYDIVRNVYLDNDSTSATFYIDSVSKKDIFMYQVAGMSSSNVPYVVTGQQILVGIECTVLNPVTGNIIDLKDENGNIIYSVTLNNETNIVIDDLNVPIENKRVSAWVNSTSVDLPVLKINLKKVYNN